RLVCYRCIDNKMSSHSTSGMHCYRWTGFIIERHCSTALSVGSKLPVYVRYRRAVEWCLVIRGFAVQSVTPLSVVAQNDPYTPLSLIRFSGNFFILFRC